MKVGEMLKINITALLKNTLALMELLIDMYLDHIKAFDSDTVLHLYTTH